MSKSRKIMPDHVQFRPAPEVLSMANSALGRVQKLLGICETRLNSMEKKAGNPDELPTREIQALVRMILTLQKEWDKYAAIVYPATALLPSAGTDAKTPGVIDKKAVLSGPGAGEVLGNTATMLLQKNTVQDSEAFQVAALASIANADAQTAQSKKQAKAQKFSHAFFQKRPQSASP